ncbi:MAG TPA: tetratricopeptide repeat protein [Gammaproteobacteria bacterium]|nr:tetratricopeptide repeat protein [Gammaproteobacteria bacterium]
MSLLLDALKRAAQEKLEKQRQDEAGAPAAASVEEVLSVDVTDAPRGGDNAQDIHELQLESRTDLRLHRADVLASELQAFMGANPTEQQATRRSPHETPEQTPAAAKQDTSHPLSIPLVTATPAAAARLFKNKRSGIGSKPVLLIGGSAAALLLVAIFYALYLNNLNRSNVRVERLLAGAEIPAPASNEPTTPARTETSLLVEQEAAATPTEQTTARDAAAQTTSPEPTQLFSDNAPPAEPDQAENTVATQTRSTPRPRLSVKKNKQEPLHEIVLRGYNAYQQGDFATAETEYRRALARAPESRDALLGIAATSIQKGDYTAAMASYTRLLDLDPNDDLALAGISGLKQDVQGAADETLLKRLLQKRPESAQLHFALGNVYAAAADWPKAQSAYFDAHRNDSQNPDYAYNLAISLEHLRQPETALRYYELAINLSGERKPNFDLAQASARISALQAYTGGATPDAR